MWPAWPREDQSGRISASELRSLFQKLGEDRNRLTTELGGMGRLWWWRNPRCEAVGPEVFQQFFLGQIGKGGWWSYARLCQMIRIIYYFNIFHGVDLWNRFLGHLATGTDPNRWVAEFVCKYLNKFRISRLSITRYTTFFYIFLRCFV